MPPTRRALLGTATSALAFALAGCTGDGEGDGTPTTTDSADRMAPPTEPPSPTESATSTSPSTESRTATPSSAATVRVRDHPDLGPLLVGPDGLTLYMFDSDTHGAHESACTGGCAGAWPPLTVDGTPVAGDGVAAELDTFERLDGSTQVTAGGWPLYYFGSDGEPGDANGQGVGDNWWVLGPDGTPKRPETTATPTTTTETPATVRVRDHDEYGQILVDAHGMTLYVFEDDTRGAARSSCTGGCATAWPPLTVDGTPTAGDGVEAALSTFERDDDGVQVAANGWPLYGFQSDDEPGDAYGQGVDGVWRVLDPRGRPIREAESDEETDEATATPTAVDDGGY
ncbi:MAG: hypothetical protein ABEJ89_00200 [Haloarculaceae archaeon]